MTAVAATAGDARPRFSRVRAFGSAVATIMVKELRSRMRGRRAFVVLTIYLALLAAVTYAIYLMTYSSIASFQSFAGALGPGGAAVNVSAAIGQAIFTGLSLLQILLVSFMAPAFTAGSISLEREKQTLDLLISTPLRPGAIVLGKLLAALTFVFLMILAAIPLTAIVLMYGGAGIDDVLRQQIVLFVTAIGFGSVGLFFSALLKRTQAATVLTHSTVLALTLGTGFLFLFWTVMVTGPGEPTVRSRRAPEVILYLNPFVGMADVIANTEAPGTGGFTFLLSGARGIDPFAAQAGGFSVEEGVVCDAKGCMPVPAPGFDEFCPPDGRCVAPPIDPSSQMPEPFPGREVAGAGYFWPRFTLTFAALSVLLTLASTRLVVPAGMRFAFGRRRRSDPGLADLPR